MHVFVPLVELLSSFETLNCVPFVPPTFITNTTHERSLKNMQKVGKEWEAGGGREKKKISLRSSHFFFLFMFFFQGLL